MILHKVLKALGFPVLEEEEKSHRAGESTLKQVRTLQERLKIKFDDKYVIDQTAYEIMIEEMIKTGITDKSDSFIVNGRITNGKGDAVKRQKLVAFDINLCGAAIYRTVNLLKEVQANVGFEFLGESISDNRGNYYIEFVNFQFGKDDKNKADIIVYAVNEKEEIIGRSRIVNTEEYSDMKEAINVDLIVSMFDKKTEYDILMGKLSPFLKQCKVTLIDLAKSNDQIKFVASGLDESESKIQTAVDAEVISKSKKEDKKTNDSKSVDVKSDPKKKNPNSKETRSGLESFSHELLYGIGRQNIALNWQTLYKKTDSQLKTAIENSTKEKIIKVYSKKEIAAFLEIIQTNAAFFMLQHKDDNKSTSLEKMLSSALPKKEQQEAFINSYRDFKNRVPENEKIDYKKFWSEYLPNVKEFKENPELVSSLLLAQQLIIISGRHQPLMAELQVKRKISSVIELVDLSEKDWKEIIAKTGVPEFIKGSTEEEKIDSYAKQMQSMLNAAYPTQKIASMLKKKELRLENSKVAKSISSFLISNEKFDFSTSRINEFEKEIKATAPEHFEDVKNELKSMQRVFQVSPTPEVMGVLMTKKLDSAYTISNFPRKSFIQMYGAELGGERMADAVYQRAEHISTMMAERSMRLYEATNSQAPAYAYSDSDRSEVMSVLSNKLPNYSELFGSPDICECEQCRSVYSAAAYYVDLLRFLWRGVKNIDDKSPLDMFAKRRPDLLHLPLTCENANTIIPYIDLVNEVMEYYTVYSALNNGAAYNTGKTTADELRANPQNFVLEAYQNLKNAVYPLSLPYHQPLDVIRTYSDHLKTERYDVMKGMQNDIPTNATIAIEAEALRLSEEEYIILTGKKFDGTLVAVTTTTLPGYYGYTVTADLEKLAGTGVADGIHEFLRRTGVKYTDLIELVKTKFINPHQGILKYLEDLFANSTLNASQIYAKLKQINEGIPDTAFILTLPLEIQNGFNAWVLSHFNDFDSVITLYQSNSMCDLNTTYLRTIHNVYTPVALSGISNNTWSKIHRFIRLWKKLGWKIQEVDLMLNALGEDDITDVTISKLSYVVLLNKHLKLPINQLATFWGSIDTNGDKSLYKKLFLNKSAQRIDSAFQADGFGNYLSDASVNIRTHIPSILAAFRISEDDLNAIIGVARVNDNGVERPIDLVTDVLNIYNLSVIYRYSVFSKALKLKVPDFCLLTQLFNIKPFSILFLTLTNPFHSYASISSSVTLEFFELLTSVKKAGFKPETLQYIFNGTQPADSSIRLTEDKVNQVMSDIRKVFTSIDQTYPATPSTPLTVELLRSNLLLTFDTDLVNQLIGIIGAKQSFSVITDNSNPLTLPGTLPSLKYTYSAATGMLTCYGTMTTQECILIEEGKTYSIITDQSRAIVIPTALSTKYSYNSGDGKLTCIGIMTNDERTLIREAQTYSVFTDLNLAIVIPSALSPKYSYTSSTGEITCDGVMTDSEKTTLSALLNNNNFKNSLNELATIIDDFKNVLNELMAVIDNYRIVIDSLCIATKTFPPDSPSYSVITDTGLPITIIPNSLSPKFSYTSASGRLACTGVMSDAELIALKLLPGATANFKSAVESIYRIPEEFIRENFSSVFGAANTALQNTDLITLLNHTIPNLNVSGLTSQPIEKTQEEKLQFVYSNYIPFLKQKLYENTIIENLAAVMGLNEETVAVLLRNEMQYLIESISAKGLSAEYFPDPDWTLSSIVERIDPQINFNWGTSDPILTIPPAPAFTVGNFSVIWTCCISPPSNDEYNLIVDVKEADEAFELYLDGALILRKLTLDPDTSWEVPIQLNASRIYRLILKYQGISANAGISLSWKTAKTVKEIIPSTALFQFDSYVYFTTNVMKYHMAAKFISGFKLTEKEVNHFVNHNTDFNIIDFKNISPIHWKRINDYVVLRNAVPQAQASLIDVFAAANDTTSSISSLTDLLNLATAWDLNSLRYLINTHFILSETDFKNEIALFKIYNAVSLVLKTGLSAETLTQWSAPETNFNELNDTAELVKRTIKAKYEEEDWLKLAGKLNNKIRENQKQALISHLLTKQALIDWGAADADGLFEYFLIDVQMGACMDTSRIVQASAAVQMFVNRCLLNLESDKLTGSEKGVAPEYIDTDRWEWMKYYRVWEVNRKIFLYPENWLEPDWRDDRSPFFKELESELTQNDITDRSVETAFRNYLTKLNTVADLDVCGMYQENYGDGKMKMLHVFGRTHAAPYQFFYRTCNEFYKWSAWEKVQVDIRMTEEGDNSGVHLIPVVWKKRLFIFWTEFNKKQEETKVEVWDRRLDVVSRTWVYFRRAATTEEMAKHPPAVLKAKDYYEIKLAWSENIDGKWSPKQLSKEFIKCSDYRFKEISKYSCIISTNSNNALIITLRTADNWFAGSFHLTDIQSSLVSSIGWGSHYNLTENYKNFYMKQEKNGSLDFNGNTYLLNTIYKHKILYRPDIYYIGPNLENPFFYQSVNHTYFVRPIYVQVVRPVRDPWGSWPLFFEETHFNFADKSLLFPNESGPAAHNESGSSRSNGMNTTRSALGSPEHFLGIVSNIERPFLEAIDANMSYYSLFHWQKALEFNTFYHPYSSQFVTNLNEGGIKALMNSDNNFNYNDNGETFALLFDPDFNGNLVKKAPLLNDYRAGEAYTFYKENVCFDVFGANSIYNWELFFHTPLYIATRLSKNGKFEEAMKWFHYIFDPTTDEMPVAGQSETSRYWKTMPFKTTPAESLESWFMQLLPNGDPSVENAIIAEWRNKPFRPFVIARNRPLAFMKNVVIKYVENLRAWGDSLFRMFTRESVNEALQLYVIANHILGPRPEFVPKRGEVKAETFNSLEEKWDDFSNALVEMENSFPFSSAVPVSGTTGAPNLMGMGKDFYFCIPPNDKLMEHWDTIADRLYKIRHCMDIDGVERQLALFSPPIDPAMLINAAAQGISLGSILSDLSSHPPIYRFNYLMQKANEFCGEVKSLGSTLLSVLEKKDSEELGRLRASHETAMLDLMTAIKERQILDAKVNKEGLLKSRASAEFRLKHYNALISSEDISVPGPPAVEANLNGDSQLPPDTGIIEITAGIDVSLVESSESGVKIIRKEQKQIEFAKDALISQQVAGSMEALAGILNVLPNFGVAVEPFGVGASMTFGGSNLGAATSALAKVPQMLANMYSYRASQASQMASYIRRQQDWTLHTNLAAKEITQLDKQITSADIKIQIAQKELSNHKLQIENTKQVEQFLKDKFTNQELYTWMKEQLFSVYKLSYNMAYDMAKKVEKCYRYELGNETASFISYGYWDNAMQGLCAGEKLQLSLRQLEKSYIEENKRELELTKSISMALLNPLALQELRTTGKCNLSIPEELYDLDYQGHYFRRIKSVSLSLPCIAGPFTAVNCTLRLIKNTVRINTSLNPDYTHNNDEGVWIDDDRFTESNVPVKSIATSTGQRDSGMFELSFRDERYLPFEGAGAISEWRVELTQEQELRQFDYSSISDVILHISYTAREDAGSFRDSVVRYLRDFLTNLADLSTQPLMRMFSMKHEFSNEWHKFLHPAAAVDNQILSVTLQKEHFPFFAKDREVKIKKVEILMKAARPGDYKVIFTATDSTNPIPDTMVSNEISLPVSPTYFDMHSATVPGTSNTMIVEKIDVFSPISFMFRHNSDVSTPQKYNQIDTAPDEISDLFIVLHYALE